MENVRTEWKDLESVAGTGKAIGFGQWGYIGQFTELHSEARTATNGMPPYLLAPATFRQQISARLESEPLNPPETYATNIGIVKLAAGGNYADIVKQLKESLKR